jgi:hypothetical protein
MREAAEQKAERILIRELRIADLTEEGLGERPRSDPLKWKIAKMMRAETTVSPKWIARRLDRVRFQCLPQDKWLTIKF